MSPSNGRPLMGCLLFFVQLIYVLSNDASYQFDLDVQSSNENHQANHHHLNFSYQPTSKLKLKKSYDTDFIFIEQNFIRTKRTNDQFDLIADNATNTDETLSTTINQTIYEDEPINDFDINAFYGDQFCKFRRFFLPIHGYLSLFACLFGIIANILNIIVLTRKEMHNPTNFILTGLAISDCIVMTSYVFYAYHNFFRSNISEEKRYSYAWAVFTLLHSNITIIFHTTSIWLTVILAIWRYIAVNCFDNTNRNWSNTRRAIYVIFLTYLTCICLCIPAFFTYSIKPRHDGDEMCIDETFCNDICAYNEIPLDMSDDTYLDFGLEANYSNGTLETLANSDQNSVAREKRFAGENLVKRNFDSNITQILNSIVERMKNESYILEYDEQLIENFENNQYSDVLQLNQSESKSINHYNSIVMKFENIFKRMQSNSTTKLNHKDELKKWISKSLNDYDRKAIIRMVYLSNSKPINITWRVDFSDIALMNKGRIRKINFWVYSILNKIIPCCALTYLSLALIQMLYQSNERRHRLRSYGQQQFYSQAANSSFYNTNPSQSQLPTDVMNSTNSQKCKLNGDKKELVKSLPSSPNASNPNLLDPNVKNYTNKSNSKALNESVSANNLITKTNQPTSVLSLARNQFKKSRSDSKQKESCESLRTGEKVVVNKLKSACPNSVEMNSNQSLNQPSHKNSNASYIYPVSLMNTSSFNNRSSKPNNNTNRDRTTRMLLAILFLFLITEIPSGIISLLAGIFGDLFLHNVYNNLGELMDFLALINNGVNFILYCAMSRQFRKTFQRTFLCNRIGFFIPSTRKQTELKVLNTNISANQMLNRNSIPDEKLNSTNQRLNQDGVFKKVSIDDDDQELVTMNETHQHSSTVEVEDDFLDNNDENCMNRVTKNSIGKSIQLPDIIAECTESTVDKEIDMKKSIAEEIVSSNHIANGSLITKNANECDTNAESNSSESPNQCIDNSLKSEDSRLRSHRNSSIDSTCDQSMDNRRNKLLHRYNDSRRIRRKTIANM